MKWLFTTARRTAPSTLLASGLLARVGEVADVRIDFFDRSHPRYDVVLFMGYDHDIARARRVDPSALIGVIDPRPPQNGQPVGADFILANGFEMRDWYLSLTPHVIKYYLYPLLESRRREHRSSRALRIGYHGNKIHLHAMVPRVMPALERLAETHEVELVAMYNREVLGDFTAYRPVHPNFRIRHVQWHESRYETEMAAVDIGIVPNLMPIRKEDKIKRKAGMRGMPYNEHPSDYLVRFKATSNPGRLFVFAQCGVPVVADMFPSALQIVEDGVNGFVCFSSEAWYLALKALADSPALRTAMADRMRQTFDHVAAPPVQNDRLVRRIQTLQTEERG